MNILHCNQSNVDSVYLVHSLTWLDELARRALDEPAGWMLTILNMFDSASIQQADTTSCLIECRALVKCTMSAQASSSSQNKSN